MFVSVWRHFCFVQGYQLLNCDDHKSFLTRHGKDPAEYRPDICHQVEAYNIHLHCDSVSDLTLHGPAVQLCLSLTICECNILLDAGNVGNFG